MGRLGKRPKKSAITGSYSLLPDTCPRRLPGLHTPAGGVSKLSVVCGTQRQAAGPKVSVNTVNRRERTNTLMTRYTLALDGGIFLP